MTSPLAPKITPELPSLEGVTLSAVNAGLAYNDRVDVMLALLDPGTTVAGTHTKSTTASANVEWGRKIIKQGEARVVIVNAGNANAFNGSHGEESITRIVGHVSEVFDCPKHSVFPCSTGVIGEPLPDQKITDKLAELKQTQSDGSWLEAATAIMTTDTFPKLATVITDIDGVPVTINGIAKGSGMIAPNMATMLSYIFTDAKIPATLLQALFADSVERSFNCITVDSDTSTSDTALLFATGKVTHAEVTSADDSHLKNFKSALDHICLDLAHQIIKDGEGATKFITVTVTGASTAESAKKIALSIANSPLVKTAIAGEDANWGRIIMAIGKTEEPVDRNKLSITVGDINIVTDGQLNPSYQEKEVTAHMEGQDIDLKVNLNQGLYQSKVWTCDLTHNYITINADYRS